MTHPKSADIRDAPVRFLQFVSIRFCENRTRSRRERRRSAQQCPPLEASGI